MARPTRVLLVGCGITSVVTANLLKKRFENISITIWEKLKQSGGRFNTTTAAADGSFHLLSVDLGAQYITTTCDNIKYYDETYSSLLNNKIIIEMNQKYLIKGMKSLSKDKVNYIAPLGMKSIVDHFLDSSELDSIQYEHKLVSLHIKDDQWHVSSEAGKQESFDIVILTIPVPEVLKLNGDVKSFIDNSLIHDKLNAVKYSSRFAFGLFFNEDVNADWDSAYIDNNDCLRFVANDSWKKNNCFSENKNKFRTAVVHTTIQFGEKNFDSNLSDVENIVMKQIDNHFKTWPKPSLVISHQWKYSQVIEPYDSKPGAVVLSDKPLLIAGGDSFVGSTFDQCLYSARTIVDITLDKYCVSERANTGQY